MHVLAFTGMPGSGKSHAVDLAKQRDLPIVRMGDLVRREAKRRDLEMSEADVGRIAVEMRDKEGDDVWAVRTLSEIQDQPGDVVIVDGVRGFAEVERFREDLGGDFVLVAVHASPDTRWQRVRDRGRDDDVTSFEEFKARDERELGFGLGTAIALADVLLVNEADLATFEDKVGRVLDRFA